MIKRINTTGGQTALILILLAAAALIFLAITMNWGRIAQTKSALTIAADQAASLVGSDAASYGEMEKQQYLKDENSKTGWGGLLISILGLILAIAIAIFAYFCPAVSWFAFYLAAAAVAMAAATLVLQAVVIQPMISSLWNKLQANQPIQQQFLEQGVSTALEGAVGDQVNISDYFDSNANGQFGLGASKLPYDTVGRFALFYNDRLKMLNQPDIPQVVYFYNQLGALVNGTSTETCTQNAVDSSLGGVAMNAACPGDCVPVPPNKFPTDPACQKEVPIPNNLRFQLNDACPANSNAFLADGVTPNAAYNPYCDPCCQQTVPDPLYNPAVPNPLHPTPNISNRPSNCSTNEATIITECLVNNPYGANYPYIYDPTYQNYTTPLSNPPSFLDLYGRDQQAALVPPPPIEPPFYPLTIQGAFPNGIYPFFWLMKDYSPEVDNIDPATVNAAQLHWCNITTTPSGYIPPGNTYSIPNPTLTAFPGLTQLGTAAYTLPYACSGPDCCVGVLDDSIGTNGLPAASGNTKIDIAGSTVTAPNPATDPSFGESISTVPTTWTEGDNQFCSANNTVITGQCADGSSCTMGSTCPAVCNDDTPCGPIGSTCPSDGSTCASGGPCAYGSYNGVSLGYPDGSCEWTNTITTTPVNPPNPTAPPSTVDGLDDTMHTLSDFVNYSNKFLGENVDTLSSTFSTWYPQVADWIDPTTGRLASVYSPSGTDKLGAWNAVITNWLNQDYSNADAWCVPPEQTLLNENGGDEDYEINLQGTANDQNLVGDSGFVPKWGDLGHVLACLNYNASTPVALYQACLTWLEQFKPTTPPNDGTRSDACVLPPPSVYSPFTKSNLSPCDPIILGRSLTGLPAPAFTPGSITYTGNVPPTCDGALLSQCTLTSTTTTIPNPPASPTSTTASTVTGTESCSFSVCDAPCSCYQSCGPLSPKSCVPGYVTCTSCGYGQCGYGLDSCSGTATTTETTVNTVSCNPSVAGSFANWVQNSLTLAQQAQPKFSLRYLYMNDIFTRSYNMENIFSKGDQALQSFLGPGGPAAQLMSASKTQPAATLPNSVIYGWIDNLPNGGSGGCSDPVTHQRVGCAHIVKVTVYAPGRGGPVTCPVTCDETDLGCLEGPPAACTTGSQFIWPFLPKIATHSGILHRTYELVGRDGFVYVSVKRWDEDHTNPVSFPNGHALWQFTYHNPTLPGTANPGIGGGSIGQCAGLNGGTIGFGLEGGTASGLVSLGILPTDLKDMGQAFMLDDRGDGTVDANAKNNGGYSACLTAANQLLDSAPESHACVEYIASTDATKGPGPGSSVATSGNGDYDYTMKFVDCNGIDGGKTPPDDLTEGE